MSTDNPTPEDNVLANVSARNEFYRDSYRKVLIALNVSIVCMLVLIAAIIYIVNNPPKPRYFATYADGKIVPLIPLSQPNISKAALLQWANTALIAVNTYDFVNYRDSLQRASEYFTPEGWQAYLLQLKNSLNLSTVLEKKLSVTAVATQAPVIINEGIIDGTYTWVVQTPVLVNFESPSQTSSQSMLVTLTIKRISTLANPNGIGIVSYIATQGYVPQDSTAIAQAAQEQ